MIVWPQPIFLQLLTLLWATLGIKCNNITFFYCDGFPKPLLLINLYQYSLNCFLSSVVVLFGNLTPNRVCDIYYCSVLCSLYWEMPAMVWSFIFVLYFSITDSQKIDRASVKNSKDCKITLTCKVGGQKRIKEGTCSWK